MKEIQEILAQVGSEELKAKLEKLYSLVKSEFLNKPASTGYHHVEKGGMERHVKEVMNIALDTYDAMPLLFKCSRDDVVIASFCHDMSKIGRYVDLPFNDWRRQAKYGAKEFEYNHTKVSMDETAEVVSFCLRNGLDLTDLQINAITYHHGFVSESAKDNPRAMEKMTGLSVLLHFADMLSVKAYDEGKKQ